MIGVQDLKKGTTFEFDGNLYRVLDYEHIKIARGGATIKIKARDLRSGATINRTFNSGHRVQDVQLESRTFQYLYFADGFYYFMDTESFEQPALSADLLADALPYLIPGLTLDLVRYGDEYLNVDLPTTVDLEVTHAEPGFAGDTATGATKNCTTETGLEVQVPLFVEIGDVIRVNTSTGGYVTRV